VLLELLISIILRATQASSQKITWNRVYVLTNVVCLIRYEFEGYR